MTSSKSVLCGAAGLQCTIQAITTAATCLLRHQWTKLSTTGLSPTGAFPNILLHRGKSKRSKKIPFPTQKIFLYSLSNQQNKQQKMNYIKWPQEGLWYSFLHVVIIITNNQYHFWFPFLMRPLWRSFSHHGISDILYTQVCRIQYVNKMPSFTWGTLKFQSVCQGIAMLWAAHPCESLSLGAVDRPLGPAGTQGPICSTECVILSQQACHSSNHSNTHSFLEFWIHGL